MDKIALRRTNLRTAINAVIESKGFKSDVAFCEHYDLNPSHISQLLNGHGSFGERAARNLERKAGWEDGLLDRDFSKENHNPAQFKKIDMEVSERIIQRMTELKIRQVDLVEATGATKGAVSKWVAGTNIPKAEFLHSLASVLKTSQNWLLTGEQDQKQNNFNMQEFMDKHGLTRKEESSFDVDDINVPTVIDYEVKNGFIWIDVVEANFSCGTGESIEFHFDVINGKFPFPPSFFQKKYVDPRCMRIIKAKGDSMSDFIHDGDLVGIDISQTEIIDGGIYAVYFEGEGMIKQIFKEEGGKLSLHSLNPKYRDREVSELNGLNFKVMGRQFWRAG